MSYTTKYPGLFKAPLFIHESGYWQNRMLPYLEAEGWAVITVDCAGVVSYMDFAKRLVKTIDPTYSFPEGFNMRWAAEEACLIRDRDMRQGLFVLYKNFEQLFTMADDDISACVNILEIMEVNYAGRPLHGSGSYQVLVGYGFDISQENVSQMEEFFENRVVIAADEAEYPWTEVEKSKKFFFPNGFPDPLYEDGTEWINDPDEYPESTTYTGGHEGESSSE